MTITTRTREIQIAHPSPDTVENHPDDAAEVTCPVCHTPMRVLAPTVQSAIEVSADSGGPETEEN